MAALGSYWERIGRVGHRRRTSQRSSAEIFRLSAVAALGATAAMMMEPRRGRRRRAIAADKARSWTKELGELVRGAVIDAGHRVRGLYYSLSGSMHGEEVPDQVIAERVKSRLGRIVTNMGAIEVDADVGRVFLRGQILKSEHPSAVRAARRVRGVQQVIDHLEVHEEPGTISALQGRAAASNPNFIETVSSPSHPAILAGAGIAILAAALRRERTARWLGIGVGLGTVARAIGEVAGDPLRRRMARLTGRARRIDYEKTIHIGRPIREVYDFWSHFENFPRFMTHIREVHDLGAGRSHWVAVGPARLPVEWRALITEATPNQSLAWRSERGSFVPNFGVVRFGRDKEGTDVSVRLSYEPPAGRLGDAFLSLFGSNPKQMMDADLLRLKSILESGKTTSRGEEIHLAQLH